MSSKNKTQPAATKAAGSKVTNVPAPANAKGEGTPNTSSATASGAAAADVNAAAAKASADTNAPSPSGKADAGAASGAAPAEAKTKSVQGPRGELLLVADSMPVELVIGGTKYTIYDIVNDAFYSSGADAEKWNSLSDVERDELIAKTIASAEAHEARKAMLDNAATSRTALNQALLGSDLQPAVQEINGHEVQLGEIVRFAHDASGLTAAEWNELPAEDRESAIAIAIERIAAMTAVYVAVISVRHDDNQVYAPGTELPAFSEKETASLVAAGAIRRVQ